jgi:hypothetical protein
VASSAFRLATCTGSDACPGCKQLSFGKVTLQNLHQGTPRPVQRCKNPGCKLKTKQHGNWTVKESWEAEADGEARVQQLRTTGVAVWFER